ncbi:YicS family protein [Pantoea cypripedii]|uniref:YicS family protein n=1 Tax=Pantoea cypripedii TaxID=55209 RepID=UPI002FCB9412
MHRYNLILLLMCLPATSVVASPYENLAVALREQTIVQDLRAHCHIGPAVSDEVLKKHFMDKPESHDAITSAAYALKTGDKAQYQQKINDVTCPAGLATK